MSFEPEEIEERSFAMSLRGYDRDEVDSFKQEVATLLRGQQRLLEKAEQAATEAEQQKVAAVEEAVAAAVEERPEPGPVVERPSDPEAVFRQIGDETSKILIAARGAGDEVLSTARADAAELLLNARHAAKRVEDESERQRLAAESDVSYLRETRALLATQLEDLQKGLAESVSRMRSPVEPTGDHGSSRESETAALGSAEHVHGEEPANGAEVSAGPFGNGAGKAPALSNLLEEIRNEREAGRAQVEQALPGAQPELDPELDELEELREEDEGEEVEKPAPSDAHTPQWREAEKEKLGFRGGIRAFTMLVTTAFKAAPGLATIGLILVPIGQLSTMLSGIWLSWLVDAAYESSMEKALRAAGLMSLTVGGLWFTILVGARIRLTLGERVGFALDNKLTTLGGGLPGLEHHERPEYLDKLQLLRDQGWLLGSSMNAVVNTISIFARMIFTLFLLYKLHPYLLALVVLTLPAGVHQVLAQKRMKKVEDETAEINRLSEHMHMIATAAPEGKEIRVFNLEKEIMDQHDKAWFEGYHKIMRARWITAIQGFFAWGIPGISVALAVGFIAYLAAKGEKTPGDVALAITLSGQVTQNLFGLLMIMGWVLQTMRAAGRLVWLIDYADSFKKSQPKFESPPAAIESGIHFENVNFLYPGTEKVVLEDITLDLEAGSVVALVGENGAGKTSLVKLLGRFYDPTSGVITVDGTDLRNISHDEWRKRMAAGFQDFAKFELIARETVGIGDLPKIEDVEAVEAALERAGGTDVLGKIDGGLEGQLGRQWDGGVELSVGQWQKLSLGRALMRKPLVLILDEPTSALDAETEHMLFEKFAGAARSERLDGAITVLVSHRFSTVRMADKIIVLTEGKIRETGTHEELMQLEGIYCELYSLQARAYQ
ncbi:MAG TPA: ATP-binding cassette domain-containing protein [Actinomycetota bacterium]|nr:ATP-binding cassette domain-containing protein [Actinomycetota bacterium]